MKAHLYSSFCQNPAPYRLDRNKRMNQQNCGTCENSLRLKIDIRWHLEEDEEDINFARSLVDMAA